MRNSEYLNIFLVLEVLNHLQYLVIFSIKNPDFDTVPIGNELIPRSSIDDTIMIYMTSMTTSVFYAS